MIPSPHLAESNKKTMISYKILAWTFYEEMLRDTRIYKWIKQKLDERTKYIKLNLHYAQRTFQIHLFLVLRTWNFTTIY